VSFYLDASVVLPLLVSEPSSGLIDHFLASAQGEIFVADFAAAEVASVISRLVRTGALSASVGEIRLANFDAWRASGTSNVDLQPSDARLASVIVRRFELMLRAPDALHVATCHRAGLTLVTLDRRLAVAAEQFGVQVHALAD
jgi:uncharacterized protein